MTDSRRAAALLRFAVLAALVNAPLAAEEAREPPLGRQVDEFALRDYLGTTYRLSQFRDRPVVVLVFLGTECPLARLYGPRLERLAREYEDQGVQLLGINANAQDSLEEIAAYVRRHRVSFPMLKDVGNRLADRLAAERTPEVFVLDQQRRVRYWGRIDDQYGVGYQREHPQQHFVRDAVEALLAGEDVPRATAEPVGCHIGRNRKPSGDSRVTYTRQIARILQRHCVECHRPGEIAPFSLTEYDEVAGWSETIAEVIRDQRMPPWHADPAHGEFRNARLMSDDEKQTVYTWVEHGAPRGDPSELPPPRTFVQGWQLPRPPDQVVAMRDRPFRVPSEGTVEYQYFVVDPGFQEDRWISAAEVVPGNRAVVHHAIVFYRSPEQSRQRGIGWLAAYVPGQAILRLGPGRAKLVPAGSKLIFQMHYTPTGAPQDDVTKVGFVFADEASVKQEVMTKLAINRDFEIPPHAANFAVTRTVKDFPGQAELLAIAPHMHLRGKSFRVVMESGEQREILLDVPSYDFNWQHLYKLREPLALHAGVRLECVARFDNSAQNLVNPDPSAVVRWGDQTWQEMMLAYLEIAVPRGSRRAAGDRLTPAQQAHAERTARQFMDRFDRDGNQMVVRSEVTEAFRIFAYARFDANADGKITYPEALEAAVDSRLRRQ